MYKPWKKAIGLQLLAGLFLTSSFFFAAGMNLRADENKNEEPAQGQGQNVNIQDNQNNQSGSSDYNYKDLEEAKYGKVKLGIKGGLNLSTIYSAGSNVTDEHAKIGWHIGGYAQAPITRTFAIEPELMFTLKGDRADYNFGTNSLTPGSGAVEYNLYYLALPVLGVLNLTDNISVMAGPYAAYLLGATVKNTSSNSAYNRYEQLSRSDFNNLDYGLMGAFNLDIGNMWDIGMRYSYGLRDIGKGASSELMSNARNANFQVYMGVYFK